MGYDKPQCQANVAKGGKEHQRYQPCGERLVMNEKTGALHCPIHDEMK